MGNPIVDKAARWRWAGLLLLAAATAVASFYPAGGANVSPSGHRRDMKAAQVPNNVASLSAAGAVPSTDEGADPFAPRGWQPPPPPEAAKPQPVAAPAPVAPPGPTGPPALPYKFMGRMDDESGGQMIYLARGDQAMSAQQGDVLDGTYKVLSVDADRIEFEYMPTGDKQTLNIPAADK
jgi:hypothetical protein